MLPAFLVLSFTPGALQAPSGAPVQVANPKAEQDEKNHIADLENDKATGKKYAEEAEKEYKISTDGAMIARVQRIGAEIAAIANAGTVNVSWGDKRLNPFQYTFRVLKGEDVNAFSLPGGYIYVFEGLLKQAESDDEVAGVLAHEVSHASFRHIATLQREQQKMLNISLPLVLIAILAGGGQGAGDAMQIASLTMQAKGSGWSVKAEEAADYGGFQYLQKSKYDATGMLTFMERLAATERNSANIDWGIYRTHPPGRERAAALVKYMRDANIPVRRSRVTTSYRATVEPGEKGLVEVLFGKRPIISFGGSNALDRADNAIVALNNFFDASPEMFELQAGTNGAVIGRGITLFTVSHEDPSDEGETIESLQAKALQRLRVAMFNFGFRVWDR